MCYRIYWWAQEKVTTDSPAVNDCLPSYGVDCGPAGTYNAGVTFLRSIFWWTVFVVESTVLPIAALSTCVVFPGGRGASLVARLWAWIPIVTSGSRLTIHGIENVDRSRPQIFVANHQSMFDIFVTLAYLPTRIAFLAKRSLFFIPLIGWTIFVMRCVPIDRERRRRAYGAIQKAAGVARGGVSLLIFPEGSRVSRDEVGPFKAGLLRLAVSTGLPLVPVAIRGTLGVHRKGSFAIRPAAIHMEVFPGRTMETNDREERDRFLASLEKTVRDGYESLPVPSGKASSTP